MQLQTAVEPARLTIADLEVIEAQHRALTLIPPPVDAAPRPRAPLTKNQTVHQILGGIKIIARLNGIDMTQDIYPAEMLNQRIEQLEDQNEQLQQEISELRKALMVVGSVLEVHASSYPFEDKAPSRVKRIDLDQWVQATAESIKHVMQRAENALDPQHIVPIAADPEV